MSRDVERRSIDERLSDAIVVYTGRGETAIPTVRPHRLVTDFGAGAVCLQRRIDLLIREVDSIEYPDATEIGAAYRITQDVIAQRHPELSRAAAEALAWRWSWANR